MNTLNAPWLQLPETRTLLAAFAGKAEARFVGGCVRDSLCGRDVKDIDIAINCLPEVTMDILQQAGIKAIPTGIAHGTVTAVVGDKPFQITTLRKDDSCDGRHAKVTYTDDWKADASRRDFTMNAMYLSPTGEVVDYFGGQNDLKEGVVRFIGDAGERIGEDYLRILRYFRFDSAYGKGERLGEAIAACTANATHMATLSGERVQQEMFKLLAADTSRVAETLAIMQQKQIFPPLLGFNVRDVVRFTRLHDLMAQYGITLPPQVQMAGFILSAECSREHALHTLVTRLRFSGLHADQLQRVLETEAKLHTEVTMPVQKSLIRRHGKELFLWSVMLSWATQLDTKTHKSVYEAMLALANEWSPPLFPVTGKDLLELGVPEGKHMGETLKRLEQIWEASDYTLAKETLLNNVK